ncbi:hypothetical protein A3863_07910 [Priestia endophytica]|uniref:hypothetical protein n=1 Tax=Priestia endophytica TaxID=135735 RepID=UPI000DCA7EF4|nr:hypothetical protein [Priestia endophytica]RAS90776.1 hypothetical protein A3863_07865 [Priestia endophytica]RAS90785.1 hypothetical protein A3863_07910 [Priestia endophytica]
MGNKYLYKPTSWQGFLQQLHFLLAHSGYRYFHVTHYPEHKQDKWDKIDQKLIEKYQTNMTRSQRYRNKEKKNANFWFLRYDNVAVILMATDKFKGAQTQVKEGITIDDEFYDIQKKSLKVSIGKMSNFKTHFVDGKITISMGNAMFKDIKYKLLEVAKTKNLRQAKYEFEKLNGLPAWGGINKQKFQLLDLLTQELKRHNIKTKKSSFFVKLTRDKVKVFE